MRRSVLILLLFVVLAFVLTGCSSRKSVSYPSYSSGPKAQKAVNLAYSQMGKAYRSGGASPSQGFDCSGLIYWAYRANGVKVPRVSTDQAKMGTRVPRNAMKPGDVLVFRIKESSSGLHTGIYVGRGNFIHAPRPGAKVRMEKLSKPYWSKKLVCARRVCI